MKLGWLTSRALCFVCCLPGVGDMGDRYFGTAAMH